MDSMHDDPVLLPLFPLAVVLLPHNQLPLHIFEDRYKKMIREVMEAPGREFGVVLAAGQGLMPHGCTATVEEVLKDYADGRLDILTLGRRRFTLDSVNQELEYLRAAVTYFDDQDPAAPAALRDLAISLCRQLPGADEDDGEPMDAASPQLSFHLARWVTDLEFRQQLLSMRSETERLERLVSYVPGYLKHSLQAGHLKEVAGKNGHGKLPPGPVRGA